ncbi:MAG: sulfatase-like hydrolase/transferase [Candidatus Glassbacteria bacterium]
MKYTLLCVFLLVIVIFATRITIEKSWGNLILITLDTVRADRLHCYGYEKIETPTIDSLAADGVLFENAIAPAPITLPSHTTLLTGLYPNIHGVRENTTYRLSDKATTLAEILKDNGYSTGAVVGAFVLDSGYGLDQGFTYYDDDMYDPTSHDEMVLVSPEGNRLRMTKISERTASPVTKKAVLWLRNRMDERFFLWVHYYDPHVPYRPPPPFSTRYREDPYSGEIAYVDYHLKSIIDELKNKKLLEKTLIVIAADHGESLGEHSEQTHGVFIYESTVKVPLILHYPERLPKGVRVRSTVTLADVVPTVLDLLEIECRANFNGISLVDVIDGRSGADRYVFCESMLPYLNYGWGKVFGLRNSSWKYIKAPIPELYNISRDPTETNNLIDTEKDVAERLDVQLAEMISKSPVEEMDLAETARLSSEDKEKLLSLGYVSGAPPVKRDISLRDPKEMIQYHELILRGHKEMQNGNLDEALAAFQEVVRGDSSNAMAHNFIGAIYYQRNDTAKALAEFQKALEFNPDLVAVHQNLGAFYYHRNNLSRAASHYMRAIDLDPSEEEYYIALAKIYEKTGDYRKSEETYDRAFKQGCRSPQLLRAYAGLLIKLGRLEEAKKSYEEALRRDPGNALAYNDFGNLLNLMGNTDAAISAYEQALTINPEFTAAHFNLARLLIKTGRKDEAMIELQATVQRNPLHPEAHYLLGELYYEQGNTESAKESFQRFLELGTRNEVARQRAEERLSELRTTSPAPTAP